ncbi:hypothetical protein D3C74_438270 [compost metagenome]
MLRILRFEPCQQFGEHIHPHMVECNKILLRGYTDKRERLLRIDMIAWCIELMGNYIGDHSVGHGFLKPLRQVDLNRLSKFRYGFPPFLRQLADIILRIV